jgi:serine/threonine-protein kinase RsbW
VNPHFHRALVASPPVLADVRHEMRSWLHDLDWPEPELDDIVFACSEAVCNVIEHAYLGVAEDDPRGVEVHAEVRQGEDARSRRVVTQVSDRGHWRPPSPEPSWRGRGLAMIRAGAERLRIDRLPVGTHVTIVSVPVPAARAVVRSAS